MGMMKDFAMTVSMELGYDGTLTVDVLEVADEILKLRELKRTNKTLAVLQQMNLSERMREIRRKNEKAGSGEQRVVQHHEFDSIPC